jgi:hypothetical protein
MLVGGQWQPNADNGTAKIHGPATLPVTQDKKRQRTEAMGVTDFLDKGGGAALPRKKQERYLTCSCLGCMYATVNTLLLPSLQTCPHIPQSLTVNGRPMG